MTELDVEGLRKDFPILARSVRGDRRLVYLDSGATSQKPRQMLDAERDFYEMRNAAVHRGAHHLAEEATEAFEAARAALAAFIGGRPDEVIFTRNATEALNIVAYAFTNATLDGGPAPFVLQPGDEILVTEMEHHANLVPWQMVAKRTGATLRWFGVTPEGRLDLDPSLITERTKVVALTHQSNVLGTINPVAQVAQWAHAAGALVVVDACQSVPHMPVNVAELGADFIAFSGHKMLGPTGVGCLWGRADLLAEMPPMLTGGSMIEQVFMDHSTFAAPPQRFEAGVPNMGQAVGLHAAADYLTAVGLEAVHEHEVRLTGLALEGLMALPGIRIIGPTDLTDRGGAISFVAEGIHSHDLGQVLDDSGIAVRVGHHCAWPLHRRFGVTSTTRATFYLYNDESDVQALINGTRRALEFFA